jgi:HSP20 family protein
VAAILSGKAAIKLPSSHLEKHMPNQLVRNRLFDDIFGDFASGFFVRPLHGDKLPAVSEIKIDVKENGSAYTVLAEMPGVSKQDIQVSVDGPVVTLQAEVKQHDEQKEGEKLLRSERYYGSVARSFQLPQEIDEAQAKARYDNGVLALTLPKKQPAAAQKIAIE